MAKFEIINNVNIQITELEDCKNFLEFCIDKLNISDAVFNVIIIDNLKIHELNKTYRGIDRETDVISFALEDDETFIQLPDIRILGDIYISLDKAKEQASSYNHSLKRELAFLMIHGLLHLLGYDHINKDEEEVMFKLQKELLDEYGITR